MYFLLKNFSIFMFFKGKLFKVLKSLRIRRLVSSPHSLELKRMKETTICRLCLETVNNFICPDCLFKAITSWILKIGQEKLYSILLKKHQQIKTLLNSDENGENVCIVCKKKYKEAVCPHCYLYEIYLTIKEQDSEVAREFEKVFNFDFSFHNPFTQLTIWQSLHKQVLSTRNFKPIIIVDKKVKSDIGICERCGEPSDDLKEVNGQWLCESCRNQL